MMEKTESTNRGRLIRESLIFQLKLIADGVRDLVLLPVSLIATAVGLIRGGDEPEREFQSVIELGRQTEQWINLFGQHEPIEQAGQAGSIDMLLTRAEEVVREQAREGGISESASKAVNKALAAAHKVANEGVWNRKNDPAERDVDI